MAAGGGNEPGSEAARGTAWFPARGNGDSTDINGGIGIGDELLEQKFKKFSGMSGDWHVSSTRQGSGRRNDAVGCRESGDESNQCDQQGQPDREMANR